MVTIAVIRIHLSSFVITPNSTVAVTEHSSGSDENTHEDHPHTSSELKSFGKCILWIATTSQEIIYFPPLDCILVIVTTNWPHSNRYY